MAKHKDYVPLLDATGKSARRYEKRYVFAPSSIERLKSVSDAELDALILECSGVYKKLRGDSNARYLVAGAYNALMYVRDLRRMEQASVDYTVEDWWIEQN